MGRRRSTAASVARAGQVVVVALVAYDTCLALAGWPQPRPSRQRPPSRRLRVLVPAHDEQHVLPGVLGDLQQQDYPASLFRVVVVADRCSDDSAGVARALGAEVVERSAGPEGKGAALAWHLDVDPLVPREAVVVLDADTRVPPDLLAGFDAALGDGHEVLQACIDVSNPTSSLLTSASALSYWSGNRMVQHARSVLGWSADLGGTGMCLTAEALASVGGFSRAYAEDRDLALRLVLSGQAVRWLHHLRVYDEKPLSAGAAVRQRARWRNADRDVRRRHLPALVRYAAATRSPSALDQALRLVRPGRAVLVALTGALAAGSHVAPGAALLPARVWRSVLVAQLALPPVFLARDGVPARMLLRYPAAVLLAGLAIPVQVLAPRLRGRWIHTPHTGEGGHRS